MSISVIIPTYKSTEYLDLCLHSAIKGQVNKNQIIVVVDGTIDIVKSILEKYKPHIEILDLQTNQGLCRATNFGVYNANHEKILIVNDDNVFPPNWDSDLENLVMEQGFVFAPNQVEPNPSIFPQFVINPELGKTTYEFNYSRWCEFANKLRETNSVSLQGSTLPIFMYKTDYLKVGGWDENYPNGMVADWDFFLKCNLNEFQMWRAHSIPFYHFASISVNSEKRRISEAQAHEYARYKWGTNIKHNSLNNLKYL